MFTVKKKVVIDLDRRQLRGVLCHFGRSMPVLFLYPSLLMSRYIRTQLGMEGTSEEPSEPFLDPMSQDETHKRITLLPEKLTEDDKVNIKHIFTLPNPKDVFVELECKEANAILVKASPKEVSCVLFFYGSL